MFSVSRESPPEIQIFVPEFDAVDVVVPAYACCGDVGEGRNPPAARDDTWCRQRPSRRAENVIVDLRRAAVRGDQVGSSPS